jgi:glutathione S-transferase
MLKIIGRTSSANVQKVLWLCEEMGLTYEREDAGLHFGRTRDPDYVEMNPNSLVPTIIEDDGFVLWESNSITRYLAAKHKSPLLPADLKERALAERWMDWQLAVLGPAMAPVFQGLVRHKPEERNMKAIDEGRDRFSRAISIMEHYLKRQDYLAGPRFTIGDIPCGIMTYRWFNLDIKREDYPGVRRWYDRLAQRPAYKKHIMIKMS